MKSTEIKTKIIQQVEKFEEAQLEEFYGFFLNYMNYSTNDCDKLTLNEKKNSRLK